MKLLLAFGLALSLSALVFWMNFQGLERPGAAQERFVVAPNMLFEEKIIDDLVNKGYLRNRFLFNLILDIKGWHGRLTPGAYFLSKGMNAYQLAETFSRGPQQKWVVVPAGKRKEQVALILKKNLNWPETKAREFIQVAQEGELYPDTYLIDPQAETAQVVRMMKTNFEHYFDTELQAALRTANVRNDTALKMASLIERESGGDEDKPIIAAILWNRLTKGMRLDIDATVQYALSTEACRLKEPEPVLAECDFWPQVRPGVSRRTSSPYNTYLNNGLPPGPIASPSLASLQAVANPTSTTALYYLHSADKVIHTAETYPEHQANIRQYLR